MEYRNNELTISVSCARWHVAELFNRLKREVDRRCKVIKINRSLVPREKRFQQARWISNNNNSVVCSSEDACDYFYRGKSTRRVVHVTALTKIQKAVEMYVVWYKWKIK